jgi:MFS family permease
MEVLSMSDPSAPCPPVTGSLAPGRPAAAQRNNWLLVAVAGIAVFMATMDASIVTVALPDIGSSLRVRPDVAQWVALGYFLPLIALALPSGRWLDGVGRRSALLFAGAGFGISSAICGLAPGIGVLVAARVLQGAFGSALFAMTPVLATMAVRPEARGRALSVNATLGPLGAVAGPALGGLLVGQLGWRWIFYVNVPVCAIMILLGLNQMRADGPLRLPGSQWVVETALLGAAVTALLLGLTLTAGGGLGWLAVGVLAMPFGWLWARLRVSEAPRRLLSSPGVRAPLASLLTMMTALGLMQYLTPFFLAHVLHAPVGRIGTTVLAFPAAMAAIGPLAGMMTDRWSARPRSSSEACWRAAGPRRSSRSTVPGAWGTWRGGLRCSVPVSAFSRRRT